MRLVPSADTAIVLGHSAAILSQDIKKLCICTASFAIRTWLAVQKQSFFYLLGQNDRRMTKVYNCICTGGKPNTIHTYIYLISRFVISNCTCTADVDLLLLSLDKRTEIYNTIIKIKRLIK